MLKTKDYFNHLDVTTQSNSMTEVDEFESQPTLQYPAMERQQLPIPPLLEPVSETGEKVHYHLTAQEGETKYFPGVASPSKGYNGNILGPILKLRKGQHTQITTANQMKDPVTYHWHGLMLPADADGGPMREVKSGEEADVQFQVKNEASTCWYHPHTYQLSPKQIYEGLAGLIYIEDEQSDELHDYLPHDHGVDDIPLVMQDRFFVEDGIVDYDAVASEDGTQGDHLLLNGALMTKFETDKRFLRLRLLNASNRTNFKCQWSDDSQFYQIATDGGFLNYPLGMTSLILGGGERAEIVIDLSESEEDTLYFMVNDFQALEVTKTGTLEDNCDFSYMLSLREELFNIIFPEEVADYPLRHIILQGSDERVAINGRKYKPGRVDETYQKDQYYVWRVINQTDDIESMPHPFHSHDVQFRILARNGGLPYQNERGFKDTFVINEREVVDVLVKFPDVGMFMYHCHNLEHQEHGMMAHFEVKE